MKLIIGVTAISFIMAFIEVVVGILSVKTKQMKGIFLGFMCFCAALVSVSYYLSTMFDNYFIMSLFSSIYFVSIDLMLISLVVFTHYFITNANKKLTGFAITMTVAYGVVDMIILMVNPFKEIAITYTPIVTRLADYRYHMDTLYVMHLAYSYIIIALVLTVIIRKSLAVPKEYARMYVLTAGGIILTVLANAGFLFLNIDFYDFSTWFYGALAVYLYWVCFAYARTYLLSEFRGKIFENINQGIVLFSYENTMILCNPKVFDILPEGGYEEDMLMSKFMSRCGLDGKNFAGDKARSLQFYKNISKKVCAVRCDYRPIKNAKGQILGRLFVFTNGSGENDIVTGFMSRENGEINFCSRLDGRGYPIAAAVFDINGLGVINRTYSNEAGDKAIQLVASTMSSVFPVDTVFMRGKEADLIALCRCAEEEDMKKYADEVKAKVASTLQSGVYVNVQSVVSFIDEPTEENSYSADVSNVIDSSISGMRSKKLLDKDSAHSDLISSLVNALKECDADTEAHVLRTQKMGEKLGKRLHLSESDLSNLMLLCILHDIGKIGIPSEILNKPDKLTEDEWKIMKTHVNKGYQIAMSSRELEGVADCILHHHEKWDGTGYPDGLSKETIPLLSRIIAVVDSYDAMINDRVYRKKMDIASTFRELTKGAGTQFDPTIVNEFINMIKDEGGYDDIVNISPDSVIKTGTSKNNITPTSVKTVESDEVHSVKYTRYVIDDHTKIIETDTYFTHITGYTPSDISRMNLRQEDLIPEEDKGDYSLTVTNAQTKGSFVYLEHRLKCKDGTIKYVFCYRRRFHDSVSGQVRTEIIVNDVSETYALKQLMDRQKTHDQQRFIAWERKYRCDTLTGLLTHEAYKNDVEVRILTSQYRALFIMLDADNFKKYNDTNGHKSGDECLIYIAKTLSCSLRSVDLACRMGGDEFSAALFFPEHSSDELLRKRAKQILTTLNNSVEKKFGIVSLSMGCAISDKELNSFDKLYIAADKALYVSKRSGKAIMSMYSDIIKDNPEELEENYRKSKE